MPLFSSFPILFHRSSKAGRQQPRKKKERKKEETRLDRHRERCPPWQSLGFGFRSSAATGLTFDDHRNNLAIARVSGQEPSAGSAASHGPAFYRASLITANRPADGISRTACSSDSMTTTIRISLVCALFASALALAPGGPRSQVLAEPRDLNVSLQSFPAIDRDALRAEDEQRKDKADSIYRVGVRLMAGAVDVMDQGGVTQVEPDKAKPNACIENGGRSVMRVCPPYVIEPSLLVKIFKKSKRRSTVVPSSRTAWSLLAPSPLYFTLRLSISARAAKCISTHSCPWMRTRMRTRPAPTMQMPSRTGLYIAYSGAHAYVSICESWLYSQLR